MPFILDAARVTVAFARALARYAMGLGFETVDFYVLRHEPRTLRALPPAEVDRSPVTRSRTLRLRIPGWSEMTRLPHRTEREATFIWL